MILWKCKENVQDIASYQETWSFTDIRHTLAKKKFSRFVKILKCLQYKKVPIYDWLSKSIQICGFVRKKNLLFLSK